MASWLWIIASLASLTTLVYGTYTDRAYLCANGILEHECLLPGYRMIVDTGLVWGVNNENVSNYDRSDSLCKISVDTKCKEWCDLDPFLDRLVGCCQGKHSCSVQTPTNHMMEECGEVADWVMVKFTCVPLNTDIKVQYEMKDNECTSNDYSVTPRRITTTTTIPTTTTTTSTPTTTTTTTTTTPTTTEPEPTPEPETSPEPEPTPESNSASTQDAISTGKPGTGGANQGQASDQPNQVDVQLPDTPLTQKDKQTTDLEVLEMVGIGIGALVALGIIIMVLAWVCSRTCCAAAARERRRSRYGSTAGIERMRGENGPPLAASDISPPVIQNYSSILDSANTPSPMSVSPICYDDFQPRKEYNASGSERNVEVQEVSLPRCERTPTVNTPEVPKSNLFSRVVTPSSAAGSPDHQNKTVYV